MSSDIFKNLNPGITDLYPYEPGRSIDEVIDEFDLDEVVKLASNENNNAPNKVVITANCIFPRAVKNPMTEPKIAHHKIVK